MGEFTTDRDEGRFFSMSFNEHEWWVLMRALSHAKYLDYAKAHNVDTFLMSVRIQETLKVVYGGPRK